jgi:hypothetical protein
MGNKKEHETLDRTFGKSSQWRGQVVMLKAPG